jgi:hypothetical protein
MLNSNPSKIVDLRSLSMRAVRILFISVWTVLALDILGTWILGAFPQYVIIQQVRT